MKKPSEPANRRERLRNSIIGLGERSMRKSYYPELQKRIAELEQLNEELLFEITERKQAQALQKQMEEHLQQMQKMEAIGTLAGGIAHDFNNILTPIIGYAELMRHTLQPGKTIQKKVLRHDVDQILQAGIRAKDLINQILAFSRQQDDQAKPQQIHIVIREAVKLIRSSIPKSVEIRENIVDDDTLVLVDPTKIHQVVINLCTNAYHAMRDSGGTLSVELLHHRVGADDNSIDTTQLPPGPYLLLKVSDTGCGIKQATRERIFDPYFTTKQPGEGTGMGLAVVHGIIKHYHGHIEIESKPGKGTSFFIYLPKITGVESQEEQAPPEEIPTGDEHILIIDDEPSITLLERRLLEGLGYRVTSISNPVEALKLISARPEMCDLVLTDMSMPKMNGAELAKRILKIRADLPIILCTGFSELMNEKKAKAIGVKEYVMKPLIRKEIAQAIRRSLDR